MRDEESLSPKHEKEYEKTMDKRLNSIQLQEMLQSLGVLIPSDEIVSLFCRVNKYYKTSDQGNNDRSSDSGSCSYSITQLYRYLGETAGNGTRSDFAFRLIKILALDINLWIKSLFVWAGVLLIINSFTLETMPAHIRRNMSMAVSTCYGINSGKYTIEYFFREWKEQAHTEKCIVRFKEALWKKSIEYRQTKARPQPNGEAILDEIRLYDLSGSAGSNVLHQPTLTQLVTYIKEQIYDATNPNAILTKRDLELLLLRELGSIFTSRVLNDVMSTLDKDKSGTISPTEFHHFLATASNCPGETGTSPSKSKRLLQRICHVVWVTITEPNWINTELFFLGSVLAFMSNLVNVFEKDLSFFLGKVPPYFIVMLLFIVGCNGFLRSEYEILRDDFDLYERAKDVLISHVRYSSHYNSKSELGRKYISHHDSLDKKSFVRLLEESNVHMSEVKLDRLFCSIDVHENGKLSKDDIESHLKNEKEQNKQMYIWGCFKKSCSFWGNFTWVLGSYGFIIDIFPPNEMAGMIGYFIGAFTYWIGGICLCGIIVEERVASLSSMVLLNHALERMIDDDIPCANDEKLQTTTSYDSHRTIESFEQNPVKIVFHTLCCSQQIGGKGENMQKDDHSNGKSFPSSAHTILEEESGNGIKNTHGKG